MDELPENINSLPEALSRINTLTGKKFVIIIDEWDVLIRDAAANVKVQDEYINFLRGLFKGTEPTKYIQLAFFSKTNSAFVPKEEIRQKLIRSQCIL